MPRLQKKNFASADDVRQLPHFRFEVVNLDETSVGRMRMEPGWRWSVDARRKVGGTSCQARHLGAVVSGVLHVVTDDGIEMELHGGEAYEIPPGHDAWVVGDVPYEAVEFASARTFMAAGTSAERTLGTILMTDIVNWTATLARLGDAKWHAMLLEHNDRLRTQIDRYGGRAGPTPGAGFQVRFPGAEVRG